MENFLFTLNAVMPLFLLIGLGFALKRMGYMDEAFLKGAGKLSFNIFMAFLLFYNVIHSKIEESLNTSILFFGVIIAITPFVLGSLVVPLFCKDAKRIPVIIQGFGRSNFLLLGMPMALNICGPSGVGLVSMLVAIVIPIYNFIIVVLFARYGSEKLNLLKTLKKILSNPFIVATLAGLFVLAVKIPMPRVIDKTLGDIAKMASPFALLIIGAEFELSSLQSNMRALVACVIIKLIAIPAIVISIAWSLGIRGLPMVSLLALSASPVAVSSHIMAKQAEADDVLAGHIIVATTVCSVFTIFGWVFLLKSIGGI